MERKCASEAKTRLSAQLDRVAKGEKITITRRVVPVAVLMPISCAKSQMTHKKIVEGMRALRQSVKPSAVTIRKMIEEGKRF